MSINYWNGFYKKNHVLLHSTFAGFCVLKMMLDAHIIEFGCGNGRDTFFLAQQGHRITGVDYACPYGKSHNPNFIKADIIDYIDNTVNIFDIVYTRFFLHSINDKKITKLLKWSKGLFMAEFRAKEDVPILYPNHYRNKIDGNVFLVKMIKNNFKILYYSKSKNVAKYKNENPLIIRVIGLKTGK